MQHTKVINYCKSHFQKPAKLGLRFATKGLENLPRVIRQLRKIRKNKFDPGNEAWYKPIDAFLEAFDDKNAEKLNIID